MPLGNRLREALMAACTSRAAASMSRPWSKPRITRVEPWLELLVRVLTPEIAPMERSSGVATDEAMTSGLAPGRLAWTTITGNSICGSGATGNRPKLTPPSSMIARLSSIVATGRAMNGAERFMGGSSCKLQAASCKQLEVTFDAQIEHRTACSLQLAA
ncbi:hypothetical protein D9M71_601610 [compost metagenome]